MPNNSHILFSLANKTALITGSSQGLGFAMAKGLSLAGAKIILNGRDEEKLNKAVFRMKQYGSDVCGYAFDITKQQEIEEKISLIEKNIGSIDILINNAGIQRRTLLMEVDESLWQEVIDINLSGAFFVSQRIVKE